MAMDKINGSPLLRQGALDNSRQNERVDADKSAAAQAGVAPAVNDPARGDTAEISATAHRLMELRQAVEVGRDAMTALPEIREDKVAAARARLEAGHYDSQAVRDKVADGIAGVIRGMESL